MADKPIIKGAFAAFSSDVPSDWAVSKCHVADVRADVRIQGSKKGSAFNRGRVCVRVTHP